MALRDEIEQAKVTEIDVDVVRVRKQRDQLANQNARLLTKVEELERTLSVVDMAEGTAIQPPMWLAPVKPKSSAGTLVVMLTHSPSTKCSHIKAHLPPSSGQSALTIPTMRVLKLAVCVSLLFIFPPQG